MHKQVYAERNARANMRLAQAAKVLAERFGLAPELVANLTPRGRAEPEIKALYQREALANVLEALVEVGWPGAAMGAPEGPAQPVEDPAPVGANFVYTAPKSKKAKE